MKDLMISSYNLTEISKSIFNKDIFQYHLRTLVGRSDTPENVLRGITVNMNFGDINVFSEYEIDELRTLIEDNKLMNMLCQLRIISTNPISIYQRLLENELRLDAMSSKSGLKMSELIAVPIDRYATNKLKFEPFIQPSQPKLPPPQKSTPTKPKIPQQMKISEGHVMMELTSSDVYVPGQVSWKEGPLADAFPYYLESTMDDYEGGIVISVLPGLPFYAYPHVNIYPAIQDLNRMIEAGNQVVFLETGSPEEKNAYESIFMDWGIPFVDYVDEQRLLKNGMRIHGEYQIPPFFVIQRPQTILHNSAWAGMSNDRRRGLAGIPWALKKTTKPGMFDTQPDDGFLSYWVRDAYYKKIKGSGAVQVYFPLASITPIYKIKRQVVNPLEKILGRQLYFTHYPDQCVAGVFLKNMGEWIAFRTLLRKYI